MKNIAVPAEEQGPSTQVAALLGAIEDPVE
jgi:hypothetical protein